MFGSECSEGCQSTILPCCWRGATWGLGTCWEGAVQSSSTPAAPQNKGYQVVLRGHWQVHKACYESYTQCNTARALKCYLKQSQHWHIAFPLARTKTPGHDSFASPEKRIPSTVKNKQWGKLGKVLKPSYASVYARDGQRKSSCGCPLPFSPTDIRTTVPSSMQKVNWGHYQCKHNPKSHNEEMYGLSASVTSWHVVPLSLLSTTD